MVSLPSQFPPVSQMSSSQQVFVIKRNNKKAEKLHSAFLFILRSALGLPLLLYVHLVNGKLKLVFRSRATQKNRALKRACEFVRFWSLPYSQRFSELETGCFSLRSNFKDENIEWLQERRKIPMRKMFCSRRWIPRVFSRFTNHVAILLIFVGVFSVGGSPLQGLAAKWTLPGGGGVPEVGILAGEMNAQLAIVQGGKCPKI